MRKIPLVLTVILMGWAAGFSLTAAAAPGEGKAVRAVRVEISDGSAPRKAKLGEMAREIIRLKPGRPYSDAALLSSIQMLKKTGRFSRIEVPDPDWEADALDIRFRLTPVFLIREIKVSGAFPVFTNEVVQATDYVAGSAYKPETRLKNLGAIQSLLAENGYVNPKVRIRFKPVAPLEGDVEIRIEKDAYLTIDQIIFRGNSAFSDTRLKMQMKSYELPLFFWSEGKRKVKEDISNDMKTLLAFYREKGFAEAVIRHEFKQDGSRVSLIVTIIEGPEYRIRFAGNRAFWSHTLKNDLLFSTRGNINDFGLRRSIKNIKKRYIRAGYPECRVDYTSGITRKNGRKYRDIRINIRENTRYIVRSLVVEGAGSVSRDLLEAELLTREKGGLSNGAFVEAQYKDDQTAIETYYADQGIADTKVTATVSWDKENKDGIKYGDISFKIREGRRIMVEAVRCPGVPAALLGEMLQLLETKPGRPFVRGRVQKDREAILSYLGKKGYIYAQVAPRVTSVPDTGAVVIEFRSVLNDQSFAGGVWAFGNIRTKDEVVLRHNTIRPGAPASLGRFLDLQKQIRDLNCIEGARFNVVGIEEHNDTLFFIADLEERPSYYLETSLGYDTARDGYIAASMGDRNFQGMNRDLYLDAEVSGVGYETVLGIRDFDLMAKHILAEFSLSALQEELKNKTFGTRKYGAQLSVEKAFFDHLKLGTSLGLEFREQYQVAGAPRDDTHIFTTRGIATITPFVTWNSVDSFVKPTRGAYLNISAGYHKDILEEIDHFIKYRIRGKYFARPWSRLVLAFQGIYGQIQNFRDSGTLPDDQLFFLGGISDVRGFDENKLAVDAMGAPLGGKTQIAGSMEARIDLGKNFELPIFFDAGSIRGTGRENRSEEFKFSIGSGIRYMTPVGPVGLLYGYKLNPDEGESSGRFHFSIGYTF